MSGKPKSNSHNSLQGPTPVIEISPPLRANSLETKPLICGPWENLQQSVYSIWTPEVSMLSFKKKKKKVKACLMTFQHLLNGKDGTKWSTAVPRFSFETKYYH